MRNSSRASYSVLKCVWIVRGLSGDVSFATSSALWQSLFPIFSQFFNTPHNLYVNIALKKKYLYFAIYFSSKNYIIKLSKTLNSRNIHSFHFTFLSTLLIFTCFLFQIIIYQLGGILLARHARKKSSTQTYHVVIKGADRQLLFEESKDYIKYLDILEFYKDQLKFEIYAYCLMSNHVHLLLRHPNTVSLESIFRHINTTYACWFNAKYDRTGFVQDGQIGRAHV